jgi:hypothetical protein
MATGTQNELVSFHRFLSERLTNEAEHISPEEALDLWRADHPAPDEPVDDVAALKEALADMEAGDCGLPLEQFHHKFCQRHSLSPEV